MARLTQRLDDSDDDDGFFEQSEHSSLGEPDSERAAGKLGAVSGGAGRGGGAVRGARSAE